MKDEKSAAKFHYIKTVSGKVVEHSIAFRVVSIGEWPLPPEILRASDLPSPVNGILWEMSELITQERIDVGSSCWPRKMTVKYLRQRSGLAWFRACAESCVVFNTEPYTVLPHNSILNTANMQSETGFPSSHQLMSYVASKSAWNWRRAVLSADAGLLVYISRQWVLAKT